MPDTGDKHKERLKMIDVERRLYGRRYTFLPVDSLDQSGFTIECQGTYMRPAMYDLCEGDLVRWQHDGHYLQGTICRVERTQDGLRADLDGVEVLPADFFPG